MFLIKLCHANVSLGGQCILKDINWTIVAGENWRIEGDNGAGKSSLLSLIAGKIWPVAADKPSRYYGFNGQVSHRLVNIKSNIGFASYAMANQYGRCFRHILAGEVMASGFKQTLMLYDSLSTDQQDRLQIISRQLQLEELLNQPFLALSHGQKSMILFARAVIHIPQLLVLDEVFNGIDSCQLMIVARFLKGYQDAGGQLVVSWHEADSLALGLIFTHKLTIIAGRVKSLNQYQVKRELQNCSDKPAIMAIDSSNRLRNDPLIQLRQVQVYLNNKHILKEINWSIHAGDCWLLSGENGSGKTTLLKTLYAQIRPAVGSQLSWAGLAKRPSVWEVKQLIAYVSPELQQSYHYNITVRDVIASGFFASIGLYHCLSKLQYRQVEMLSRQFYLDSIIDCNIHQLSCGQFRRALIARAMSLNPEILLFDEVLANLDQPSRKQIRLLLENLLKQGKTIIIVSHHPQIFKGLYNRKALLRQGRLEVKS